jgi:pyrroloquinoline-quinone synthase
MAIEWARDEKSTWRATFSLMKNQLDDVLDRAVMNHQLLTHPFYQRWEAGELSRYELIHYAEQYRYFESMLPMFLEGLCGQLPDGPARESVMANLSDEVTAPSHLGLFEKFAFSLGAGEAEISTAMSHLVESYFHILRMSPVSSLAGLWAYESQGATIADSKAAGLLKHYGMKSDAIEFWTVHGSIEGDHAKWTLRALDLLDGDAEEVGAAAQLIAAAWWNFLDERELLAA